MSWDARHDPPPMKWVIYFHPWIALPYRVFFEGALSRASDLPITEFATEAEARTYCERRLQSRLVAEYVIESKPFVKAPL